MEITTAVVKPFSGRLEAAGCGNPQRAAETLLAHVLGCRPLEIYFRDIRADQQAELEQLIVRAEQGEPVQYITGQVNFRGVEIRCDRRALIPRPETELLVEAVLERVRNSAFAADPASLCIADIGTGTGCIALALLDELPDARVTGTDLSREALDLARENAERLGVSNRFKTIEADLLDGMAEHSLDLIVSNPPYIASGVCAELDRSVRDFEPHRALDGGEDGLDLIRALAGQAAKVLKPGGALFLEIGYDQGAAVSRCLREAGFQQIEIRKDYAGHDRIVCANEKGRVPMFGK
jgi:release factor glutamine methyltransferase